MLDPGMATHDFKIAQGERFSRAIETYEKAIAQAPSDAETAEWRERLELAGDLSNHFRIPCEEL